MFARFGGVLKWKSGECSIFEFPEPLNICDGDVCKLRYTMSLGPDSMTVGSVQLTKYTPLLVRLKRILHTLTGHCFE